MLERENKDECMSIKADVEKLMDSKKVDMVFTDPPYNIAYNESHKNERMNEVFGRKFKNKAEIKIKLQKIKEEDLYVSFYNQKIYKKCYRLDTYINIVEDILKKGVNKNVDNTN